MSTQDLPKLLATLSLMEEEVFVSPDKKEEVSTDKKKEEVSTDKKKEEEVVVVVVEDSGREVIFILYPFILFLYFNGCT